MQFHPLNPGLYYRLQAIAGTVKPNNLGMACKYVVSANPVTGKPEAKFLSKGEYYNVCCPYCGDRRYRLSVGHLYGQRDSIGRRMTYVAICFNARCLDNYENARDFLAKVDFFGVSEKFEVKPGEVVDFSRFEAVLPGECPSLAELAPTHPAVAYLAGRLIDVEKVVRLYDVRYCLRADPRWPAAQNRIIIPIRDGTRLLGWQGRYIGDLPWKDKEKSRNLPPKYYTLPGMPRSYAVYDFDRARRFRTGVLVEGPTDKWNLGGPAFAIFGSAPTDVQMDRIVTAFSGGSLLFCVDPEEYERPESKESLRRRIDSLKERIPTAVIRLPDGYDPGSTDRDLFFRIARSQAAEQRVPVDFSIRPVAKPTRLSRASEVRHG